MLAKKNRSICCLAFFCSLSSISHAQGRVTLYGLIDEGLLYQSNVNGGKRVFLESLSGMAGSRWGITGVEELGSDTSAVFTLEAGLNVNNGQIPQGGTFFGRQVFVGLSSKMLGTVTFGRQYDMVWYFPEPLIGVGLSGAVIAHPGDFDNAANSVRLNNAVRYMSPVYNGFSFGAEYSLGGVPGNVTASSGYSLGAGYAGSTVQLAAAFEYFKNPNSTPGSGFFTAYANGVSLMATSLNKGYVSAQAYQAAVVAGHYVIGPVTLGASFSNVQFANLGPTFSDRTAIFNDVDVGAMYQINPAWTVGISYLYTKANSVKTADGRTVGNQHYNSVGALTDYVLSKRTDVYFGVGWTRASGTSSLGTPAVANAANFGESSNNHAFITRVGFRHKF